MVVYLELDFSRFKTKVAVLKDYLKDLSEDFIGRTSQNRSRGSKLKNNILIISLRYKRTESCDLLYRLNITLSVMRIKDFITNSEFKILNLIRDVQLGSKAFR